MPRLLKKKMQPDMGVKNYSPGSEVVLYEGVVWSLGEAGTGDAENICELAILLTKAKAQKNKSLNIFKVP